jgi:hypothetical protein
MPFHQGRLISNRGRADKTDKIDERFLADFAGAR